MQSIDSRKNRRIGLAARLFGSIACFALLVTPVAAQSDRGAITGTVTDPGNAVVPNANVVVVNAETGTQYQTVTTGTGNYTLVSLPAGSYELSVEASGFKKYVQRGISVAVAQTGRIDVALQIGATSEAVTVQAEAAMLKTESAEQAHNMSGQRIGDLPINFSALSGGYVRSPYAFITMEPGANNTGQNVIRVNGMPNSSQSMYVEGQDATMVHSAARIDEIQPSVESIEAAALQTSNFSAEFGQIVGGLFNFNAKSGTNQFHGSAYEYLANDALNAGITFTDSGHGHLIRPAVRKNDFGFTIGGPVSIPRLYNGRNRTFFFVGWEFYKERRYTTGILQTVPTVGMRNGDFSQILTNRNLGTDASGRPILENTLYNPATARQLADGRTITDPFPGNLIPQSAISPIASKIQAFIPAPSSSGLVNNWNQTYPAPKFQSVPSFKIDHSFNERMKASFYWSRFRTDQYVTPDGLPSPITALRILYERNDTMRLNYDYTVTPRVLLHMGAGYIKYRNPDVAIDSVLTYDAIGQLGLKGGIPYNFTGQGAFSGFPRLTGLNTASYGMGLNMGPANANLYAYDKPTAVVNVTYIQGNHSYKIGADYRIEAYRDRNVRGSQGIYNFGPNETGIPALQSSTVGGGTIGSAYASFLLGLATSASVQTPQDPQFRKSSWSLFIQDNWKVTRKLTLDYGLRWDLQGGAREIHDRFAEFSATTLNPTVGLPGATIYAGNGDGRCNCQFTQTYPYAIGPRLGVAYTITPKTVLRVGWGITFGNTSNFNYISNTPIIGGAFGYNQISFVAPGFGTPAATFAQGLPYTREQLYPSTLNPGIVPFPGQNNSPPYWIDINGGRPPRINQWNIGIQREITRNLVVEAAYVGNRGVWLIGNNLTDINALTPERLRAFGLDINNAANRTLLTSTFASGAPQGAGFKLPYGGFPTGLTLAQALRPFPQFLNIPVLWSPRGNNWYDSLQAKVTHRLAHGLDAQYSFTWQKELTNAEGTQVNDVFNLPVNKIISGSSIPLVSAISFNYEFPAWGSSRVLRNIVRDWRFGGALRYQSGLPILSPLATNNLQTLLPRNVAGQSTYANPTGQPFFTQDPNCHCFDPNTTFVLNPAAWSQPAAGQWGVAAPYYNNYRWQRQPAESLSFGRTFRIREGMSFQVRAEFFNVFNRVFLSAPTSTNAAASQVRSNGQTVSGFGYINTSVTSIQTGGAVPTVRNGQIVARLRW